MKNIRRTPRLQSSGVCQNYALEDDKKLSPYAMKMKKWLLENITIEKVEA